MSKVNFLDIYNYDSGTEEICKAVSHQYETAAREAIEKAGYILKILIENNPEIDAPWYFRLKFDTHNKPIQPTPKSGAADG